MYLYLCAQRLDMITLIFNVKSTFNGSFRRALQDRIDFRTHVHTLNGWAAVFFMSAWLYRGVVKHFLLFVVLWTLKQRGLSLTQTLYKRKCAKFVQGAKSFSAKSKPTSNAHIHIIFKYLWPCLWKPS